jgi:localization factor PodJL
VFYARGDAVARNDATAFGWFQQAAEFGVADSQYNLGLLYQHGHGVEPNVEQALYWFLVAARQHDLNAIDRAVALAAEMAPDQVARVQARARRFQPRHADLVANEGLAPDASCAAGSERPENS